MSRPWSDVDPCTVSLGSWQYIPLASNPECKTGESSCVHSFSERNNAGNGQTSDLIIMLCKHNHASLFGRSHVLSLSTYSALPLRYATTSSLFQPGACGTPSVILSFYGNHLSLWNLWYVSCVGLFVGKFTWCMLRKGCWVHPNFSQNKCSTCNA